MPSSNRAACDLLQVGISPFLYAENSSHFFHLMFPCQSPISDALVECADALGVLLSSGDIRVHSGHMTDVQAR